MPGIAEIALGAAPIAGGALLGAVAGNLKGPDVRAVIKADLDMLVRIAEGKVQRRTAMSQMACRSSRPRWSAVIRSSMRAPISDRRRLRGARHSACARSSAAPQACCHGPAQRAVTTKRWV
ncbi:hypothetical protein H7J87_10160 [Mycolicibacterium wolinskyi]|uniref:Uncharacterized protein n=1 Tax=Mycolicibacterium wolinskyi TaxID=59750 RepID=A0A1X2FB04_9MYCO|nr:hypothetical protein [Mycolicibacterium wolinskyi]MCV7291276.1 hypothetical protein [Mycolicibacterium goodii]ORX15613.1 hypothetical protein AWC31_23980 [Mycolicibacterium wolinskyi]